MATEEEREANIKRLRELLHQERKDAEEREYQDLLQQLQHEIVENPKLLENEDESTYTLPEGTKPSKDLDALIKDYESLGKKPTEVEGRLALSFDNEDDAASFFKEQADKGRSFDFYNKASDHRVYSDGETFVQGKFDDVKDYLANKDDYEVGKDGTLTKRDDLQKTPSMN